MDLRGEVDDVEVRFNTYVEKANAALKRGAREEAATHLRSARQELERTLHVLRMAREQADRTEKQVRSCISIVSQCEQQIAKAVGS